MAKFGKLIDKRAISMILSSCSGNLLWNCEFRITVINHYVRLSKKSSGHLC